MAPSSRHGKDTAAHGDQCAAEAQQPAAKRARRQSHTAPGSQGAAPGPVDAATASLAGGLTPFEAERQARIAANKARLAALELPHLAAGLAATAAAALAAGKPRRPPASKGISAKRSSRAAEQLPRRQSARARGQAPDAATAGGIEYEGAGGRVVLAAYTPQQRSSGGSSGGNAGEAAAAPPPPPGPLPFCSGNGDDATDAAFVQLLQQQLQGAGACAAGSSPPAACSGAALSRLRLAGADVAKLTKHGISCLAFHPSSGSSGRPIIAAADKGGNVGLWDIDHPAAAAGDAASSSDGVLVCEPHRDYVSSLKWLGPRALLSGSYDGLARRLDVEAGVWDLVAGLPPDIAERDGWSAGEAAPDGTTLYLATSAGQLVVVDTRAPAAADVSAAASCSSQPLVIATRKVNTLHLHASKPLLASSASDGSVAVWDVRQLAGPAGGSSGGAARLRAAKPVAAGRHAKSCQGAYWDPLGGQRLLSISFDDTLRLWGAGEGAALTQQVSIRHNNNTGRWLVPFRPCWSPDGSALAVGDMKRGVALFDAASGSQAGPLLAAEPLTAIPSRLAMQALPGAAGPLLAAATSSGRVHIFR